MKSKRDHNYWVYITTNINRKSLYTGVTNNLARRMMEHKEATELNKKTFAGQYKCYYLIYFEHFQYILDAIAREKHIKGWTRKKKEDLINLFNPEWDFLNDKIEL